MNHYALTLLLFSMTLLTGIVSAGVSINKLENVSPNNLVYSGFLPISSTSTDQLFFTYYGADQAKQQESLKDYPLVIVVGSPGSSAQYLNMAGLGPILLQPDMSTAKNPNSVTNYANVMFVDLLGTGFSFVSDPSLLNTKYEDYGIHLTYAINQFAKESVLGQSEKIILVGEGPFLRALPGLDDIDSLSGLVHLSAWSQLYVTGKYYGVAGIDLKIFGDSERIAIESTFISCYNYVNNKKWFEAHNCYDSILNFVESKTKNINLFNVALGSNLTQHLAMIQYYFSQSSTVSLFKAPNSRMFETQSNWVFNKTYQDLATNKTGDLSQFMKDYLSVKHLYVSGSLDFIAYKQALKFWLQNQLAFVESATFAKAKLEDLVIGGKTVGYTKECKQVKYIELFEAGHYVSRDQSNTFSEILKDWLEGLNSPYSQSLTEEESQIQIVVQ